MKSLFLFALCCVSIMHSQMSEPNKDVKKLLNSGRNHIISLAIKELKRQEQTTISKEDFHFISVKASNQRVLVQFGYNVIYLPKNTAYYSDIIVELPSGIITKNIESNDTAYSSFYLPTHKDLKIINEILNPDSTNIDVFKKGIVYPLTTIKEMENSYLVVFSSRDPYLGGVFSEEEIDKKTGEVISSINGHYEPAPILPDDDKHKEEFIEITN